MTTMLWRIVRRLSSTERRPAPVTVPAAETPPPVQQEPVLTRQQRIDAIAKERSDGLAACQGLPEELRENAMGLVEMEYRKKLGGVLHE